jgi:lipopolysaccharide/colanic/teichoic acid biosynthesis glycosyltransferase
LRKRFFDFSLAILLLILLSPLLVLIATIILLLSGKPIFFQQKRMGQRQQKFTMIKFRTMYHQAHRDQKKFAKQNESPFPAFKITNDPRFVGIGRMLSKTGLDEIPQLINIIRGEMSFIGPRPLPISEAIALPLHWHHRHLVKPGILSLWALAPERHKSLLAWKKLEIETLSHGSVKHDLQILWKSLAVPGIFITGKIHQFLSSKIS